MSIAEISSTYCHPSATVGDAVDVTAKILSAHVENATENVNHERLILFLLSDRNTIALNTILLKQSIRLDKLNALMMLKSIPQVPDVIVHRYVIFCLDAPLLDGLQVQT